MADFSYVYLDQQCSLVEEGVSVIELCRSCSAGGLQEHEIRARLHGALVPRESWERPCRTLSGGERVRLYLCCLMISNRVPDVFVLDEPTNNLDLSSLDVLAATVRDYRGTLLVISHDRYFVDRIGITRCIGLEAGGGVE
jgi:ATPase subunit of ABC transporter with duplicated ATPase domains